MKRTVWVFGLIAGAMLSIMMLLTMPFIDSIGFDKGLIIGYTSMVLGFLMIFFGVKSYRDNVGGGSISFLRGLTIGLLITAIASTCYVGTWLFINYTMLPDFADKYAAYAVEQARKSGASQAEIEAKIKEMDDMKSKLKNPVTNAALTFLEPLPVGVVMALISAALLRRKESEYQALRSASGASA